MCITVSFLFREYADEDQILLLLISAFHVFIHIAFSL
jgi:hypothetical protein